MKALLFYAALVALAPALPAHADAQKPLTVAQCIDILNGLNSLSWAGQQLLEPLTAKPADAKQYKLGALRFTISQDIAALTPVLTQAQTAQNGFSAELPPLPPGQPNKPDATERVDAIRAQNNKLTLNWKEMTERPCPVTPGHLKFSDLKIGDGEGENQFPPSVLGAVFPLIDGAPSQ